MLKKVFINELYNRKIYFILVLILFISTTVHAGESRLSEAPIYIDDQPLNTRYIMKEGHLLVPSVFLKNTGAYVDWDAKYQSVVFKTKDKMFALPVGKDFSDDYDRKTGIWVRNRLSTMTMDYGGEPFVPLMDVVKKLGMGVRYDPKIATTFITTNISIVPNNISKVETSEKLVSLTFDDGPENYYTPKILDILKEKGVPATFFVVGRQIKFFPDMMKRIVEEGHGIGNHTFYHPDIKYEWSSKVKAEIESTQQEMQKVVGRKPDLFRFPYGSFSKADLVLLNELGMKNMLWSVDTLDWSGLSADLIIERVHQDITPGAIILQHNFQSNTRMLDGTVEALPRIIDDLQKQGYKFVTLQTLMNHKNQAMQGNR